jgi:PAS domain S-box-containing protein
MSKPPKAALPVEADALLDAIRNNEIDALVIKKGEAEKVFALRSIDDLVRAATELRHAGAERRLANAARRELERRFETLASHAPVGIFMHDAAGACVYVNRRVCEIIGISPTDALAHGLLETLHPEDRERVIRARQKAIALGEPFEAEYRYRDAASRVIWVTSRSVALTAAGGKLLGRIGTLSDITEQKKSEAALQESRRHLQALLDQRERLTQDLHDGCIQSIYAIGLNLQSCRQLLDDCPEAERIIAASAANLNLVIQELRAFIGRDGGQPAMKPDLAREIDRAGQAGRELGLAFDIGIDSEVAGALAASEALHLLQIAREAISNATRHAKAKSISVKLSARSKFISLEIADDGIGFNRRARQKSGLGLHHIDARARALNGEAKIQSAPGNGTRVVVRVPRAT